MFKEFSIIMVGKKTKKPARQETDASAAHKNTEVQHTPSKSYISSQTIKTVFNDKKFIDFFEIFLFKPKEVNEYFLLFQIFVFSY